MIVLESDQHHDNIHVHSMAARVDCHIHICSFFFVSRTIATFLKDLFDFQYSAAGLFPLDDREQCSPADDILP